MFNIKYSVSFSKISFLYTLDIIRQQGKNRKKSKLYINLQNTVEGNPLTIYNY